MRTEITNEFTGTEERNLKVFWNENASCFEVETPANEIIDFYDEPNEQGDGSNGKAAKEVQKFIDEFQVNIIKKLRKKTKLSQQEFANKYGIPKRTIENWESGTNQPPEYVLEMLEKIINNNIGQFEVWEMNVPVEDITGEIKPGCTYGCNLHYDPVTNNTKFSHLTDALAYMRHHHFTIEKDSVIEYHLYELDNEDIIGDAIAWSTEKKYRIQLKKRESLLSRLSN